jgi:sulfatase maturation enzyme AslB (radical SAM superfamily)
MVVNYSEDEYSDGTKNNMVYIHTHLNKKPFWKRIIYGIKYIFGYKCRYGAFDEFIVNPKDADKIQEIVNYLKKIEK